MTPSELATLYFGRIKHRGDEIIAYHCPFCKGGSKHETDTFAMNAVTGTFNCKRGSCARTGSFKALCDMFGEYPDIAQHGTAPVKRFVKPEVDVKPLTSQAEQYLASRGISRATMDAYDVGCDDNGNILFPFKLNGEIVFTKYRPARKLVPGDRKAWRDKDTKPILFGMDMCDPSLPLTITEGELDSLALREAGIDNAVSVPSGASDLTWIDHCWDWLEQYDDIILCGDMDAPGREMVTKLTARLGAHRCRVTVLPDGCKDANEVLYRHGKETLVAAVEQSRKAPISGAIAWRDVDPRTGMDDLRIATNLKYLDRYIKGLRVGEITIITGKRGEGKSTVSGQLLLEGLDQGIGVCAYSGELPAKEFLRWVSLQAAGSKYIEEYHDNLSRTTTYEITADTRQRLNAWFGDRAFLYDNDAGGDNRIFDVFESVYRRHGCQLFLIDNLMIAGYTMPDKDALRAQSKLVNDAKAFAKRHGVHIIVVAHPRKRPPKTRNNDDEDVFDGDDVAGLGDVVNLCDNLIVVRKPEQTDGTVLKILKCRMYGRPEESACLRFCPKTKRVSDGKEERQYGWESS